MSFLLLDSNHDRNERSWVARRVLRCVMALSRKVGRTGEEMSSAMEISFWSRSSSTIFGCVSSINKRIAVIIYGSWKIVGTLAWLIRGQNKPHNSLVELGCCFARWLSFVECSRFLFSNPPKAGQGHLTANMVFPQVSWFWDCRDIVSNRSIASGADACFLVTLLVSLFHETWGRTQIWQQFHA